VVLWIRGSDDAKSSSQHVAHVLGNVDRIGHRRRVAHALELRAKTRYEPSLYVRLHRTLYPTSAGSLVRRIPCGGDEGRAGVVTRERQPAAFTVIGTAAGCSAAARGIFWGVVQPVNLEMEKRNAVSDRSRTVDCQAARCPSG
jgi:hypothetical protein